MVSFADFSGAMSLSISFNPGTHVVGERLLITTGWLKRILYPGLVYRQVVVYPESRVIGVRVPPNGL